MSLNIWAPFVRKFVAANIHLLPNLFTLIAIKQYFLLRF